MSKQEILKSTHVAYNAEGAEELTEKGGKWNLHLFHADWERLVKTAAVINHVIGQQSPDDATRQLAVVVKGKVAEARVRDEITADLAGLIRDLCDGILGD